MTTDVEMAQAVVQKLEQAQRQLAHRGIELTEERQRVSFGAHTGDQRSRARLDKINSEIATHASEVASIEAAIAEADNRLGIAQREAAAVEDAAAAQQLADELKIFAGHGRKLDAALQALVEHGQALEASLLRINSLGAASPSRAQLDSLGALALHSSLMLTPWAREFRHLAPRERKTFTELVRAWTDNLAPSIARRLGMKEAA